MTNCESNFIRIYNVNKGHLLETPIQMQITIYITGVFIHNNWLWFSEVQWLKQNSVVQVEGSVEVWLMSIQQTSILFEFLHLCLALFRIVGKWLKSQFQAIVNLHWIQYIHIEFHKQNHAYLSSKPTYSLFELTYWNGMWFEIRSQKLYFTFIIIIHNILRHIEIWFIEHLYKYSKLWLLSSVNWSWNNVQFAAVSLYINISIYCSCDRESKIKMPSTEISILTSYIFYCESRLFAQLLC